MTDLEYILDFASRLGCRLLTSGANLERVEDTMQRICRSYHLTDVSLFSLNSIIQIGARTENGDYAFRQVAVAAPDFHLKNVNLLNRLSRRVCRTTPEPSTLSGLLDEISDEPEYPQWMVLLGRLFAMGCMCILFGGTFGDVIAVDIIVFVMFFMIIRLHRANLNRIIINMLCMLFVGIAGLLLVRFHIGQQFSVISITCSMVPLPGIAMVNAARNLLCGNEMNGILEFLKALIETLSIVLGLGICIYLFGGTIL